MWKSKAAHNVFDDKVQGLLEGDCIHGFRFYPFGEVVIAYFTPLFPVRRDPTKSISQIAKGHGLLMSVISIGGARGTLTSNHVEGSFWIGLVWKYDLHENLNEPHVYDDFLGRGDFRTSSSGRSLNPEHSTTKSAKELTIKPRKFPEEKPNVHCLGLSFIPYLGRAEKASLRIHEAEQLVPRVGIHHLIYLRKREVVFGTGLVEAREVNAHSPCVIGLRDRNQIGQPNGIQCFLEEVIRLNSSRVFIDVQSMENSVSINPSHIRMAPCQRILILLDSVHDSITIGGKFLPTLMVLVGSTSQILASSTSFISSVLLLVPTRGPNSSSKSSQMASTSA
uniref:Uncharacterized protein n=1 Tax=Cannabis sativa TaxID=3483 RepID=A0A803PAW4_CANSA